MSFKLFIWAADPKGTNFRPKEQINFCPKVRLVPQGLQPPRALEPQPPCPLPKRVSRILLKNYTNFPRQLSPAGHRLRVALQLYFRQSAALIYALRQQVPWNMLLRGPSARRKSGTKRRQITTKSFTRILHNIQSFTLILLSMESTSWVLVDLCLRHGISLTLLDPLGGQSEGSDFEHRRLFSMLNKPSLLNAPNVRG